MVKTINKQVGIVIFTAIEVVTLVVWLAVALETDGIVNSIIALAILIGGFTAEHLITFNVIHHRPLFNFSGIPVGQKAVVSLIEAAIWIVWLALARAEVFFGFDAVIAAVVLAGLLIIEHTVSDNVFTKKRLFERLADRRTIGFSIIEAAGAAIWLALIDIDLAAVGVAVLAAASFIEHNMAVELALREEGDGTKRPTKHRSDQSAKDQ